MSQKVDDTVSQKERNEKKIQTGEESHVITGYYKKKKLSTVWGKHRKNKKCGAVY